MYSKNDYRYYLENQLMHSDDFLAHYGVKGMKWKQHLKKKFNNNYEIYNVSGTHNEFGGPNGQKKVGTIKYTERGIESKKNPNRYISVGSHKSSSGKRTKDIYFSPTKKEHYLKKGRLEINTGEEGSHISLDVTKKKRKKNSTVIKEKKIPEQIIKEKKIYEKKIPEQMIKEEKIYEKKRRK